MKFSLDSSEGITIRGYGEGHVVVALPPGVVDAQASRPSQGHRETVTTSVVLTPDRIIRDGLPETFEQLEASHFEALMELEPEVVLFGSGAKLRFPAPALLRRLTERGMGVEVMDTAAACRTYNVLIAEGRRVTAALLMI